jgi:hypothetical protein
MRRYTLVIIFVVSLILLTGCLPQTTPPKQEFEEYSLEDVLAIDFTSVEQLRLVIPYEVDEENTSFEIKDLTREEDRLMIYDFLKEEKLTEVKEPEEKMGFDIFIEIKREEVVYVVFNGDQALINNIRYYASDRNIGQALIEIYNELDYEAERME